MDLNKCTLVGLRYHIFSTCPPYPYKLFPWARHEAFVQSVFTSCCQSSFCLIITSSSNPLFLRRSSIWWNPKLCLFPCPFVPGVTCAIYSSATKLFLAICGGAFRLGTAFWLSVFGLLGSGGGLLGWEIWSEFRRILGLFWFWIFWTPEFSSKFHFFNCEICSHQFGTCSRRFKILSRHQFFWFHASEMFPLFLIVASKIVTPQVASKFETQCTNS